MEPDHARGSGARLRGDGLGSLSEALDRILSKGVTVDGAVTIGVAGVDLLLLDLRLLLAAVDTIGPDGPFFSGGAFPASAPDPSGPGPSAPDPSPTWGPPPHPPATAAAPPAARRAVAPAGEPPVAEPSGREGPRNGLIRLVLTLVNLLHEVLERQAVRRMGNGTLTPEQIEDVGTALYAQAMEILRLRRQFGLSETDLTLRLSATG